MMKQTLLIFTKNVIYGQVKTRLAATIGKDKALHIYQQLLRYTSAITNDLQAEKIVLYATQIDDQDMWNNDVYKKQIQHGDDLGKRMENAFNYAFEQGSTDVIIIGSDCFEITTDIIKHAFDCLKNYEIVIGPATDGGYYLLAMKQLNPLLFKQINWSTNEVLTTTLGICHAQNLSVYLLPVLSDIDTEEDLKKQEALINSIALQYD